MDGEKENQSDYIFDVINDEKSLTEGKDLFMTAMANEDGLSRGEFDSEESVIKLLKNSDSFVVRKKPTLEIVGVFLIRGSPMVRSENTIYAAQYMILKPEARGKGLGVYTVTDLLPGLRSRNNFIATIGRTSLVSSGLRSSVRGGNTMLGTIPNSNYLQKYGWVEDVIEYSSMDPAREKVVPFVKERLDVPPFNQDEKLMRQINEEIKYDGKFPTLHWKGQHLKISKPSSSEAFTVEGMIRQAASEGQGFAVDEFNSNGFMNRRLLNKNYMLVIKSENNSILAGLVFGPTKLCRDSRTTQVGGYMIVNKAERCKSLGKALLNYCLENMRCLGYNAILTDVFVTNKIMLNILEKNGFIVTATVPNSGIMKGNGRTNTYIMYKPKVNIKFAKL